MCSVPPINVSRETKIYEKFLNVSRETCFTEILFVSHQIFDYNNYNAGKPEICFIRNCFPCLITGKDRSYMNKRLRNLAILGIVSVGAIACVNKAISLAAEQNDHLPIGKGTYYKWKYGNIYYTKTGSGSPVLLVHDLNAASSAYEWSKITSKLSRSHTVYALDLLGCGRSDKPNLTYTNYMYVQLINDFIKNVIGSKTSVAATGDSFSFIVMACNIEPANFDRLIGVSPCDLFEMTKTPGRRMNILKYIIDSPVIGTFLYNLDTSRPRVAAAVTDQYFCRKYMDSESVINAYYKGAKNEDGRGKYLLASTRSHYTNINIIPAIRKINNSICLIGGRMNPLIMDVIDEYQTYNPSIEDAYVANANYLPQLESPDRFLELLNILLG